MLVSKVRRYADPDEYAGSIRGTRAEFTIAKPGRFEAKLTHIDLHHLWMQRLFDTLPRVAHIENIPGRVFITFHASAGPSLLYDGHESSSAAIMRFSNRYSGFQRSTGVTRFASMSLPVAEMEALGASYGGADFTWPRAPLIFSPSHIAMERLKRLHAEAGHLAEHTPHVLAESESARGLEQALLAVMADCLSSTATGSAGAPNGQHALIMKRFRTVTDANPDQVLHVPEICKMIGTSNRTLTTCCNEALGMSPRRYLRIRQLNLARRALALADSAKATVTDIATANGFWELGRFAVAYRMLFGESPSAMLRRTPRDVRNSADLDAFLAAAS